MMNLDFFYGRTPEILVADDTLDSLKLLSESLRSHGYGVRSVTNGTLALASAREAQPDLILLDIRMPDISGYEVCRQLQHDPQTQDIPIIFISALHESFDKVEAFAVGGVDYITKPFHIEEVLVRIQSQLVWRFTLNQSQIHNAQLEQRVQERTDQLTASNRALRQEIQERKQIETDLRDSEAKFRQISEHIHEVFWLIQYDAQTEKFGQIEYVSPAFESIWGRPCQALYENPWEWLAGIHPDDRPRVENAFIQDAAQGSFDQEYRIVHTDGTVRWIHDRGFPIQDQNNRVYRVAGIAEDITDRKGAEQTARFLASIVASSDEAIITKTLDGIITSWNAAAVKLFGYTEAEAVGQSITMLIPPERQAEEPRIIEHLKSGEKIDHFETVRLHKNQTRVEVSVTISPLKDGTGKVIGASKIAHNITQQRQAERERDRFFNLSLDLLFITNSGGELKRLNPAWSKLLGYSPQALLGQSFWHLIHPADLELVLQAQQQLEQGEEIDTLEIRCRCQDGSYLWIAWNVVPFPRKTYSMVLVVIFPSAKH
ncbi:MAG: PAS domain S-box protein, partial [Spirulina sp. SIO3F2]|nr:PAS domain S-box protein [Spirulina sp. SIO3F2]